MNDFAAIPAPLATPPLTEGQRVGDTFVAPSKTFTDLLRKWSWWGPLIIMIVMSIVFSFAVQKKVGWDRVNDNIVRQDPAAEARFDKMDPAQAASIKAISAKFVAVVFGYGNPVVVLIFVAIFSLLHWLTVNFGFGGTAKYGQIYAVNMYASLVMNIKYLLATIALFAGVAPDSFLLSNPVGTNVGYLLSPDTPKWLMTAATHLDLFEIWSLVLGIIGISIVARVTRGKAAVAVVGWWLVLVLVLSGVAARG